MDKSVTSQRKKEHIELCLTNEVAFQKTNGFDEYEFEHNAITQVNYSKIDLTTRFYGKQISFPFLISCMTGGVEEAEKINEKLAVVAREMNIPIGVGSQRQSLENDSFHLSYKIIRKNAGDVPILGNIGAAQVVLSKNIIKEIDYLINLINADAMVIHLNPLQELFQREGEPNFSGLLKKIESICSKISIPIIAKEVGSGISKLAAKQLLEAGIRGIDVAGSGGTSWCAVELLRNGTENNYFKEWGMPTSYCVKSVAQLKKKNKFTLISSGGINCGIDIAKSIALGADIAASARIILQELIKKDIDAVISMITGWFEDVKKIMYLTGCDNLKKLQNVKLILRREMI